MVGDTKFEKIVWLFLIALKLRVTQCFPQFLVPNFNNKPLVTIFNVNSSGFVNIGPATVTINVWGDKEEKRERGHMISLIDNGPEAISKNLLNEFNEDSRSDEDVISMDSNENPFQQFPMDFAPTSINNDPFEPPFPMHIRLIEEKNKHNPISDVNSPHNIISNLAQKLFFPSTPEYLTIVAKQMENDDKFPGADIPIDPPIFKKTEDKYKKHMLSKHGNKSGEKKHAEVTNKLNASNQKHLPSNAKFPQINSTKVSNSANLNLAIVTDRNKLVSTYESINESTTPDLVQNLTTPNETNYSVVQENKLPSDNILNNQANYDNKVNDHLSDISMKNAEKDLGEDMNSIIKNIDRMKKRKSIDNSLTENAHGSKVLSKSVNNGKLN